MGMVLTSIVDLLELAYLLIPPMILASFLGKERGSLDLPFHQSICPPSEGSYLDLNFGVSW